MRNTCILILLSFTLTPVLAFANKSLIFIENKGQLKDQYSSPRTDIDFIIHSKDASIFVGQGQLHYQFMAPDKSDTNNIITYRMDVELLGCNKSAKLTLGNKQPYYENYYTATTGDNGLTAHSYRRAIYKDIYPGIDWILYINNDTLKHEFIVAEGTDPAIIKLKYSGTTFLSISNNGSLIAHTPFGIVTEAAPSCYTGDGLIVKSAFQLGNDTLSYKLDNYKGQLTIDPSLVWGTYYHGISFNYPLTYARHMALSNPQHVYLSGHTAAVDIATTGAHQVAVAGAIDVFLTKFDSSGTRLWCTYYGGSATDDNPAISCDTFGHIYMAGRTMSGDGIATVGCHQPAHGGVYDAFLAKFDSAGHRIWGTYYGGTGSEESGELVVANASMLYMTGTTTSNSDIATLGAYQTSNGGGSDAFLVKFDTSGQRIWGTFWGGAADDFGKNIAIDTTGFLYTAGSTLSTAGIATTGSHQTSPGGIFDAYLARFDTAGIPQWATYYGGDSSEYSNGLVTDHSGNVYLYGSSGWDNLGASTNNIASSGTYMTSPVGQEDAFLAKFNSSGTRLWGTYYGGPGYDHPILHSLAIDNWDNLYLFGTTSSVNISTGGVWQFTYGGGTGDGYIAKFTSLGAQVWTTYYGGSIDDVVLAGAFDGLGNLYVAGSSSSNNAITTSGAFQETNTGSYHNAFLSRINDCITPLQPTGLSGDTLCPNDTVTLTIPPVNGAITYTWSLPGGWTGSSTINTITVITGASGGNVSVIANSACGSSSPLTENFPLYPAPVPVVLQNGPWLNTGNFISYQWYLNGSPVSGADSQYYNLVQQGIYTVSVVDSNGCMAMSSQFPVSIPQIGSAGEINFYPNPATDNLTIIAADKIRQVSLRNAVGQIVLEENLNTGSKKIDLRLLAPGLYFITITDNSGNVHTGKLIKH